MILRCITALVVGLTITVAGLGLAATLGVLTVPDLFATSRDVATCDSSLTINTTDNGSEITGVTVSEIADICIGNTLVVLIDNGTSTIAGKTATISDDGSSVDDNPTTVVPDTNCDDPGTTLPAGTTATTTTFVRITDGTVICDSSLQVTITAP